LPFSCLPFFQCIAFFSIPLLGVHSNQARLPRYARDLNVAWPLLKGLPLVAIFIKRLLDEDVSFQDTAKRMCELLVEVETHKSLPNLAIIEASIVED